ncbi:cysteine synthase A [Tistlia consotensis]|uniref:Cysteine synthase A n=1 Tax=Tistlia consotensis USBA 355 TaxID=560819 RepID=A0A1Y6BW21_9PROT|nr:pyridoxal-phosphate dependent enzyme [Tistlia consotensis]SMF28021.1 cysteine synthase A [Tistlia consotensis USBA 355]SNR65258.1 cysteine synthase A [Tistlia consotensis]
MTRRPKDGFLAAYETPRIVRLASNLHAACFALMKLLPARFMLDRAEDDGRLPPSGQIVETSSGRFGLALALLAAVRGYALTLVSASSLVDPPFVRRLEQLGARLLLEPDTEATGAQAERLARLRALLQERPDAFWPRQYDNPDNALAYARLAELATEAIGRLDCPVGCVGSGGSLCGAGQFLRTLFPSLRIVAVDTHGSRLFGQDPAPRLLRGLGNSILPANLVHEMIDEVHWIGALPAYAAARRLSRAEGLYMGPSSGAAWLVADWQARRSPGAATLVILADEGHRYRDTFYDDSWLAGLEGWPPAERQDPVRLARVACAGESDWTCLDWARRPLAAVSGKNMTKSYVAVIR